MTRYKLGAEVKLEAASPAPAGSAHSGLVCQWNTQLPGMHQHQHLQPLCARSRQISQIQYEASPLWGKHFHSFLLIAGWGWSSLATSRLGSLILVWKWCSLVRILVQNISPISVCSSNCYPPQSQTGLPFLPEQINKVACSCTALQSFISFLGFFSYIEVCCHAGHI